MSKRGQSILSPLLDWVIRRPVAAILCSAVLLIVPLLCLPQLVKDTRSDAFLAVDNPALVYKEKIREAFGLNDPVVLAIADDSESGIFRPETLQLLRELTDAVAAIDNVNSDKVSSLATEKNIFSAGDDIEIRPFLEPLPETDSELAALRSALSSFELYSGKLVSADNGMALIIAELRDENNAEATYRQLRTLVENTKVPAGVTLHLAGEGAIAGYLGTYIDSDALRLNPMAGLIINLTIFLAFLRLNPALLANVIIVAAVGMTLGAMAFYEVPFFVITNALPAILIGISVADAIHIYSEYYTLQRRSPSTPVAAIVRATMENMWRPITLTTITTMCGFLGLYLAAQMPPFRYFGLFAALGVGVAWLFSLVFLPAALVLTKPQPRQIDAHRPDIFTRAATSIGLASLKHAGTTLMLAALIASAGLWSASKLVIDEARIDLFHPQEPVYQADRAINRHMDGTHVLYIAVESERKEGLLEPAALQKIASLQRYAESLPNVGGSISIVDYIARMHQVLDQEAAKISQLPSTREAVAQYLFAYSALADPTDFEEEIDYEYRTALIRLNLNAGSYLAIKPVVEALQAYLSSEFDNSELHATLSGRVSLNYNWFKDLGVSHFQGMALALFLVWATTALLFRSLLAGVYALVPVGGAVLLVYGFMVLLGMTLGIGSSMFAAVAIGLGVDFAIHTLERLRRLYALHGGDTHLVYSEFFQTTGRALLFNFLAIACGFGVLISSKITSLNQFGSIVVLAVSTSFIASLTVLPALVKIAQPRFIVAHTPGPATRQYNGSTPLLLVVCCAFALALFVTPQTARSAEAITAEQIVARINAVAEGQQVTRRLNITMTDRKNEQRSQTSINFRKEFDDGRRTIMFFESPSNIRGTGFLIWNYSDPEADDDQWLYLPALRRARRVSTSDRGGYFLGTDFTYEDMKLDGKLEPRDYRFELLGEQLLDDRPTLLLEATAKDEETAAELGYSRTLSWVDPESWMLLQTEFYDPRGELFKTLYVDDLRLVDGIWTRHRLTMENHQTGHTTQFLFTDVDYVTPVDDSQFSKQALKRGP